MHHSRILITNLAGIVGCYKQGHKPERLAGKALDQIPVVESGWITIADGQIADFGTMDACPDQQGYQIVDATGQWAFPGFQDSHTHLVFAGTRVGEFEDRIRGLTYQQIAAKGGGILNSAARLADTEEDELYHQSAKRLDQVIRMGTTTIEIKSGYGLSLDAELKMLRVIKRLKDTFPITIKATYLGAHAVPKHYNSKADYLNDVLDWMDEVASHQLADFVDIFCEQNYFSVEDARSIIRKGHQLGLRAKIHGNQLAVSGGVQVAVTEGALSVDHLEQITEEEIRVLKTGQTMPVLLPGCSYFINIPYAPARQLIDADLPVVLATDYNPGSCPSGNVPFLLSLACTQLRMTPAEALNAVTINGAAALGLEKTHGGITVGQQADLWLSKPMPGWQNLMYDFGIGAQLVDRVMVNGQWYR